jgi:hypothetical protein
MKQPIKACNIEFVVMKPQKYRKISDDRNLIIVCDSFKDVERSIELHLTNDEAHKLQLDLNEFLNDDPPITRIVTYD